MELFETFSTTADAEALWPIQNLPASFAAIEAQFAEFENNLSLCEQYLTSEVSASIGSDTCDELALELAYFAREIKHGPLKQHLANLEIDINYADQKWNEAEVLGQEIDSAPGNYSDLPASPRFWIRRQLMASGPKKSHYLSRHGAPYQNFYQELRASAEHRYHFWRSALKELGYPEVGIDNRRKYRSFRNKLSCLCDRLIDDIQKFVRLYRSSQMRTGILSGQFRRVLFTSDLSRLEPPRPPQFNLASLESNDPDDWWSQSLDFGDFDGFDDLDEPNNRQINSQAHANLPLSPLVIPAI